MTVIDFRFSDTAEGLPPSGSLVKISPRKRTFQIVPVVPGGYLNSRYDLKYRLFQYMITQVYVFKH